MSVPAYSRRWEGCRPGHDEVFADHRAGFRQAIEYQFEDGIVTQSVGVVGIFVACGDLKYPLFDQVLWGKVDTACIARVREHGG